MAVQMLSTLNLKRMSCKACLSDGRLSINDTDDRLGTTTIQGEIKLDIPKPIRLGRAKVYLLI